MPDDHAMSDHDLLVRIDERVRVLDAGFATLTARLTPIETLAREAHQAAQANERRLNRIGTGNAVFAAVVGTAAGVVGWLRGSGS